MAERAAIVAGASRGIGLALAEVLAEEGYGLTLTARKPDTLERAADTLRARGAEVEHVAANLGDEDAAQAVVARHRETFGRPDLLVNNAAPGAGRWPRRWRRAIAGSSVAAYPLNNRKRPDVILI